MTTPMKTKLYGGWVCFAYLAAIGMAQAQTATESVLHNFIDSPQGALPISSVVRDPAGNLYGTTQSGGAAGEGVVYKLSPAGHVTVLYNFTGEAQQYNTGVVRDPAGNLYGSAATTVFELDTAGNFTVLAYTQSPSPVTLDGAGNLYWAGAETCRYRYCGEIDKLDPFGNLTVLHNFSVEDASPTSGVTLYGAGNLYGTARGVENLIYKLDPG